MNQMHLFDAVNAIYSEPHGSPLHQAAMAICEARGQSPNDWVISSLFSTERWRSVVFELKVAAALAQGGIS